ncbi:hypothetical protein DXG03_000585 [Asterophora parasitica]|uniref:Uncharacterized protein n=1 Tax=Asterophora parasitica TaxID=117018 RepID=A0A9P7KAP8_9AGAR|nr:hypothetical protein DXG03_000585 [Asterophora parasitica]
MAPLPILLGLFFGSFGYGINLITFFACIIALLYANGDLKPIHKINFPMVVAACAMITVATCDVVVEICQNVELFVHKNLQADPRIGGCSQWWTVALFGFFVAQVAIGDTILVRCNLLNAVRLLIPSQMYRCFIVWNRKWKFILFPIILTTAAMACGIASIVIASTTFLINSRGEKTTPLITTMLVLTLTSNSTASLLIVFRIWTIQKEASRYRTSSSSQGDPSWRAIRVTIEAGLLYTASLVVLLGIYLAGGEAQHVAYRSGITFNMVISLLARKRSDTLSTIITTLPQPSVAVNTVDLVDRDPSDVSRDSPNFLADWPKPRSPGSWQNPKSEGG